MTTGPEHYRKAEELARLAARYPEASDSPVLAQLATAHATLALAAARALPHLREPAVAELKAWVKAAGGKRAEGES